MKSLTHSWFGRSSRNCRLTRSSGHGALAYHRPWLARPCHASHRAGPACASIARPCSERRPRLRVPVAATPCRRRRPACWPARRAESLAPEHRRDEPGRSAGAARAAALHGVDTLTGRPARLAERLDPDGIAMLVDEVLQDLSRRSSSAWAKNALASFSISLARRSSLAYVPAMELARRAFSKSKRSRYIRSTSWAWTRCVWLSSTCP